LLKNALFFLKKRNALNIFGKFSIFRKLDGATFFKSVTFFCDYFLVLQSDTMEERIERIGRIRTDFFQPMPEFQAKNQKKIRSYPPDPPNPFFHCITLQH
jgi:hypothetical protein